MRIALLLTCGLFFACDDGGTAEEDGAGRDAAPRPGIGGADASPDARPEPEADAAAPEADAAAPEADAAGDDATPPPRRLLRIEPAEAELAAGDPPPTLQLQAIRGNGPDAVPIPAIDVEWIVDPPEMGVVAGDTGVFTAAGIVGDARVFGEHDGDTAAATIHVVGLQDVLMPGVPADTPRRFAEAGDGQNCGPEIVYPEPFTAFPSNIQGVTFQWNPRGHDLFEAAFQTGEQITRWYTTGDELTPEGRNWARLLDLAAGGQLRLTLRGLGGAGDDACAAPEQVYVIDTSKLQGAIYYWSTADAGIMRLAAGDSGPEPFLTPLVAPEINCPACHALSREGQRIAFTRTTFPPFGDLAVSGIAEPRQLDYNPAGVVGYFPSFAPGGQRLVAGAGGRLVVRDTATGMEQEALPLPDGFVGGQPDWSWQGDRIAAVLGPRNVNFLPDAGVTFGSIGEWTQGADGTWGAARILVEQSGNQENDRPAYSPDGRFLAFTRHGEAMGMSMGNPSNTLWMLDSERGGPPIELLRANSVGDLGNSWPKWSPASGQGRLWLAFSSLRDYGHKLRQAGAESPRPQIWVTGIDPAQADVGDDPSSPAFWLPFQGLGSGNHIPYWAPYEKSPDDLE